MSNHLIVFSPHHDDAYWQAGGVSLYLKAAGWKVTFITVIGDHYQWGGGTERYREKAEEAARRFGVDHVLCDFKSMEVQGPDRRMAEQFTELIRDLKPTLAITEYPEAVHPDHQGTAINSLRALTKDWYGVPRELPAEVWCYQGYKRYDNPDFSVDVSPWREEIREALWYFDEFGEGEANGLWQNRLGCGMTERFFVAKGNSEKFTRAPELFPGKVFFTETRFTGDIIF
ncbi:MAG: PIG-L family deacetylase [Spirochaetales bacterium]|nr:PIG-L family deacetylase [Spirochaetales bacterium]